MDILLKFNITWNVFPITEKKKTSEKNISTRKSSSNSPVPIQIDTSKYRLPTSFHYLLDEKLAKKRPLDKKDYSSVARGLSKSIEEITIHPHTDSLRFVVNKFLNKYENAVVNSYSDTSVRLCLNLM